MANEFLRVPEGDMQTGRKPHLTDAEVEMSKRMIENARKLTRIDPAVVRECWDSAWKAYIKEAGDKERRDREWRYGERRARKR